MSTTLKITGAAVAGLAVGFGVGFLSVRQHYKDVYAEIAAEEVHTIRQQYKEEWDGIVEEFESPEDQQQERTEYNTSEGEQAQKDAVTQLGKYKKLLQDSGYNGDAEAIEEMFHAGVPVPEVVADAVRTVMAEEILIEGRPLSEVKETNLFQAIRSDSFDGDPDFDALVESRNTDLPYIISVDEYMTSRNEAPDKHEKISLSYYEDDNVLCDEGNRPIAQVDRIIGEGTLEMFGQFSRDKDVVYVRNESTKGDFEIRKETGRYEDFVYQNKTRPVIQRMREDD